MFIFLRTDGSFRCERTSGVASVGMVAAAAAAARVRLRVRGPSSSVEFALILKYKRYT